MELYLHSTMFLLIRRTIYRDVRDRKIYIPLCFYLYLYTAFLLYFRYAVIYIPLCFYLYQQEESAEWVVIHLHSTMFLLIRGADSVPVPEDRIYIPLCFYLYRDSGRTGGKQSGFTFHYVSTYTCWTVISVASLKNLHSTMFLLIRDLLLYSTNHSSHLHSTMFLLIRFLPPAAVIALSNLHSTMFLLIRHHRLVHT